EPVRSRRIHTHEHTALAARRDRHVPADQKGEAAEHLPLGDGTRTREQLTDSIGELLVVGHETTVLRWPNGRYGCVTSGKGWRKRFAALRCVIRRSSSSGTCPQCASMT